MDCAADANCVRTFPSFREQFAALVARFDDGPVQTTIRLSDGTTTAVGFTRGDFAYAVRGVLYTSASNRLPLVVRDAHDTGDLTFFAQYYLRRIGWVAASTVATGMYFSILCSEDMAFNDREELRSVTEGTLMGAHLIREYEKACDNWETYDVPASYHDPLRSDVPTLLLSGERDPITPPEYGEEVAKHLSRSLHVVQPNAGHGVGGPCVAQLRLQLIITGSVKDLDPSCIRPTSRPNFVVPDAPVERSEIKVAEGILETYVGQYELRPTFSIVVTLEDGQLYGQATGQSRLPLFAESEMQFFLKVVDAQITFTKDDAGVVTGLVLHQNGRDAPARKVR